MESFPFFLGFIDEKFKKLTLVSCYNVRNKKIEKKHNFLYRFLYIM
jgi:hypothetical protein